MPPRLPRSICVLRHPNPTHWPRTPDVVVPCAPPCTTLALPPPADVRRLVNGTPHGPRYGCKPLVRACSVSFGRDGLCRRRNCVAPRLIHVVPGIVYDYTSCTTLNGTHQSYLIVLINIKLRTSETNEWGPTLVVVWREGGCWCCARPLTLAVTAPPPLRASLRSAVSRSPCCCNVLTIGSPSVPRHAPRCCNVPSMGSPSVPRHAPPTAR